MAVLADSCTVIKKFVAVSIDNFFQGQSKTGQKRLIYPENFKLSVINGHRVGYAVKNPCKELFIVRYHDYPIFEIDFKTLPLFPPGCNIGGECAHDIKPDAIRDIRRGPLLQFNR
jgi:hypothetical protein